MQDGGNKNLETGLIYGVLNRWPVHFGAVASAGTAREIPDNVLQCTWGGWAKRIDAVFIVGQIQGLVRVWFGPRNRGPYQRWYEKCFVWTQPRSTADGV